MQLYTALTQAFTTHCKGGCSSFLRSFHHHDQFTMKGSHGRLYKHLCRGCITITTGVETACTVHFKEELRVCIGTEIAIFVYHTHCDESQVGSIGGTPFCIDRRSGKLGSVGYQL